LKLLSYPIPGNYRAHKILIAAELSGVEIEVPPFDFGKDNTTEQFKSKHHPLGKVPVLETPYGSIFESGAILRYVGRLRPEAGLYGNSFFAAAQIDQWIDFSLNELEAPRALWLYPIDGYIDYDEDSYQGAKKDIAAAMGVFENHLLHNTYFVGFGITLADITIACSLVGLYTRVLDPKFVANYPSVNRWFTAVVNNHEFAKFIGKVEFAKSEEKAKVNKDDKKKKSGGDKKEKEGAGDKKDKEKEKPAGADRQKSKGGKEAGKDTDKGGEKGKEKPKGNEGKAASSEANLDLMDALEKPQKKEKNPLDLLPESPMILDATKKHFFSSKPPPEDFFKTFWQGFDPKGYCMYHIKYKFDAENTVYFMTQNALGGYIQRSDDCRKYAFGVLNMYGADENKAPFKLNGAWIFRGPEIIKEMKEVPDSEYYTWTRLDHTVEADRQLFEKVWLGESPSEAKGDTLFDRRYFK